MGEPYLDRGTSDTDTSKIVVEIRGVAYEVAEDSDLQVFADHVAFTLDNKQPVRLK